MVYFKVFPNKAALLFASYTMTVFVHMNTDFHKIPTFEYLYWFFRLYVVQVPQVQLLISGWVSRVDGRCSV